MKFGKSDSIEGLDLSLPKDHPATTQLLSGLEKSEQPKLYIGFPTWAKAKLPGFYPRGTKDELGYYSTQMNAIELNASFYRIFPKEQFAKWRDKTPEGFMFFPKVVQNISHWQRLKDTENLVNEMIYSIEGLEHKLGRVFLQMHNNYGPKDFDRVITFVENWPKAIPLAMEFRHTDWHTETSVADELHHLLQTHSISNVITDTTGRRDMLHMRLTTPSVFVRFTAANHPVDDQRLDDWADRLASWIANGLEEIDFFIHQNADVENPLLASSFRDKMTDRLGRDINAKLETSNPTLF
ncbi:MAG: DUF72 domain-containing protein [Flavobacteriales bacterium]|nr:DUF72 domain-containing protein [Flavobacteriales bacterium]MCB9205385.1 DUF72 domain-containing protein [Flavobacteriales bacterium]